MVRRPIVSLFVLLALAGCADPPGVRKPLPLDYQEQSRAVEIYKRVGPQIAKFDGVIGSYLTQSNNPRRLVVLVRDRPTREAMQKIYGREIDGLRIRYEVAEKGFESNDGAIEAVPKQDLPQTWWDRVIYYFKNFAYRVLPSDAPSPPVTPPPTDLSPA